MCCTTLCQCTCCFFLRSWAPIVSFAGAKVRRFFNSPNFLPLFFQFFLIIIFKLLKINYLKNNSKILVEIFGQFKKLLYFCTRFREGSRFIKIDEKFFLKKVLVVREKVVILHPLSKREWSSKNRLKKFFEKDLVNWKKGCTFAPAKMASEKMKRRKIFWKKIW